MTERTKRSCDACRRRRTKCVYGESETCAACESSRIECTFEGSVPPHKRRNPLVVSGPRARVYTPDAILFRIRPLVLSHGGACYYRLIMKQDQITLLEEQVKALEEENSSLKARLAALEGPDAKRPEIITSTPADGKKIFRLQPANPKLALEPLKMGKLLSVACGTFTYVIPPLTTDVSRFWTCF